LRTASFSKGQNSGISLILGPPPSPAGRRSDIVRPWELLTRKVWMRT
jgi:hypothetical protein